MKERKKKIKEKSRLKFGSKRVLHKNICKEKRIKKKMAKNKEFSLKSHKKNLLNNEKKNSLEANAYHSESNTILLTSFSLVLVNYVQEYLYRKVCNILFFLHFKLNAVVNYIQVPYLM